MNPVQRLGDNARGILMIVGAVFLFTIMDSMAKAVSERTDTVMALWARYTGQTLVVFLLVLPRLRRVLRTRYPGLQFLRSVFLLAATTFFFFGISLIGLAEATAILDLHPVLITLGAAVVLGERFGPRRAAGVAISLIGALIIIRPGSEVFSPFAAFPFAAAIMFAGYALTTRFVGRDEDAWTSLLYTALVGALIMSAVVPFFWVPPDPLSTALMLAIGVFGAFGQLLLIRALMVAEASLVAPFSYVGLLFAILWGMILFDEFPDALTYVGCSMIIAAGVYVWYRETSAGARAEPAPARPD